jgi:hypothetical protein
LAYIAAAFVVIPTAALAQTQPPPDSASKAVPEFPDLKSFAASLPAVVATPLDATSALWLSTMPLACVSRPHNRPNNVPYLWLMTYAPVASFETTRSFYGCSDWHSSVNSTWTLVRLLKMFPNMPSAPAIRQKLNENLGATNIAGEVEFFRTAGTFEVPYGYAWLLRLQYELLSWNDPEAAKLAANVQPLATWMSQQMIEYMRSLEQPVRTGVHPNTAMAMDNMLDYANGYDPALKRAIRENAQRLFGGDKNCPTESEPGMSDFASPCLMEAALMSRLMERDKFLVWLDAFLPPIHSVKFRPLTTPLGPEFVENPTAIAARSHIIALAFVRGKSMGELANALPPGDPRAPVLHKLADLQAEKGFQVLGAVGYAGSHYYASWALTYMITK